MEWNSNNKIDEIEARINELQRQVDEVVLDSSISYELKVKLLNQKKNQIEILKN